MTEPLDATVDAILDHHDAKSAGTPLRSVVHTAVALGYRVVAPTTGSSATYLRLVCEGPAGPATLYADGVKLTSNGKALRSFAKAVPGARATARDVQFRYDASDATVVLGAFVAHVTGRLSAAPTAPSPENDVTRDLPAVPPPDSQPHPQPIAPSAGLTGGAGRRRVAPEPKPAVPYATQAGRPKGRRVPGGVLVGVGALATLVAVVIANSGGGGTTTTTSTTSRVDAAAGAAGTSTADPTTTAPSTTPAPPPPPGPALAVTCPTGGSQSSPTFGHDITATAPYSVAIDYGDGDRYTNDAGHVTAIFTHTYASAGAFTVSAVLTDATGQSASASCVYAWAPAAAAAPAVGTPSPGAGGGSGSNDTYVNSDGNVVHSPVTAAAPPPGATARCNDGTYSFSQHHQGTCSGHHGVAAWL